MARVNFTAGRVRDFSCPPDTKQIFMWDAGVPGLGLRAMAGSVSYIFQGRIAGSTVRTTIGDTRTWDIDGARQRACELQKLIDDGKDPRVEKAAAIASAEAARVETERRQSTLGEVWPDYIKAHRQRWSDRHTKDHEKVARRGGEPRQHGSKLTVPGVLASLLDTPLPALTAEVIAQWLKREAQARSTQAALAFRLLRACLNWCGEQPQLVGLAPEAACKARTRTTGSAEKACESRLPATRTTRTVVLGTDRSTPRADSWQSKPYCRSRAHGNAPRASTSTGGAKNSRYVH